MLPFSTKTVLLFRSIKYFSSILTTLDETSGHLKQFYRKAHDIPESSNVTSFFTGAMATGVLHIDIRDNQYEINAIFPQTINLPMEN